MKKLFLGVVAFFAICLIMVAFDTHKTPSTPSTTTASTSDTSTAPVTAEEPSAKKARMAKARGCQQVLLKAQKLDVLYDLKPTLPPTVVVGPTYYSLTFDARENFARTVNCFLLAGSTDVVNFDLLDYRTHAVAGEWKYGHLQPSE